MTSDTHDFLGITTDDYFGNAVNNNPENNDQNPEPNDTNTNTNTNTNTDNQNEIETENASDNTNIDTDAMNDANNNNNNTVNNNNNNSNDSNNTAVAFPSRLPIGNVDHHEIDVFYTNQKDIVRHCRPTSWSNCDATTFQVRRGPDYVSGQKAASLSAIYKVFALDGYCTATKIQLISSFMQVDEYIANYKRKHNYVYDAELCPLPPVIIMNFMFPGYAPEVTSSKYDGPGHSMIVCAELNDETREYLVKRALQMKEDANRSSDIDADTDSEEDEDADAPRTNAAMKNTRLPPSLQLLCDFIEANDCLQNYDHNNNSDASDDSNAAETANTQSSDGENANDGGAHENNPFHGRLKCIARIMNVDSCGFDFITKRLVQRYNGKPFLCRTSSTFYHKPGEYFAVDIDVHVFGYPARKGLCYVRDQMADVIFDLGVVIEGHSNEELPEQILCCARISKCAVQNVLKFPAHLEAFFNNDKTYHIRHIHQIQKDRNAGTSADTDTDANTNTNTNTTENTDDNATKLKYNNTNATQTQTQTSITNKNTDAMNSRPPQSDGNNNNNNNTELSPNRTTTTTHKNGYSATADANSTANPGTNDNNTDPAADSSLSKLFGGWGWGQ